MNIVTQLIIPLALTISGIIIGTLISLIEEPYNDFVGIAVGLIIAYIAGRYLPW